MSPSLKIFRLSLLLLTFVFSASSFSQPINKSDSATSNSINFPSTPSTVIPTNGNANWKKIAPNLLFGKISLGNFTTLLESELYLLRFNLNDVDIEIATAQNVLGSKIGNIKDMVNETGGVAGINASFFDTEYKPLGLIVPTQGKYNNLIQNGGKLLTGIFQIKDNKPSIVHRTEYQSDNVTLALQAGPRIIVSEKFVSFSSNDPYSRRSGIAITKDNDIIIYATALRFPGANLLDIQNALKNVGVTVTDVLNFDGGGSSQFYIKELGNEPEIYISGGDEVPVGLVIKNKK